MCPFYIFQKEENCTRTKILRDFQKARSLTARTVRASRKSDGGTARIPRENREAGPGRWETRLDPSQIAGSKGAAKEPLNGTPCKKEGGKE